MSEPKPDRCPRCRSTERFARRIWQGEHACTKRDHDPWHDEIVDEPKPDPLVEEVRQRIRMLPHTSTALINPVDAVSVCVAMLRERDDKIAMLSTALTALRELYKHAEEQLKFIDGAE